MCCHKSLLTFDCYLGLFQKSMWIKNHVREFSTYASKASSRRALIFPSDLHHAVMPQQELNDIRRVSFFEYERISNMLSEQCSIHHELELEASVSSTSL